MSGNCVNKISKNSFTILYVEDEKETQNELVEILKPYFSNMLVASNGAEAISLYKKNKVDIVLTDILMPTMDGLELTKYIKNDNPHMPVVVITAHSEHKYLIECIKLKVDGYILKPVDLKELHKELNLRIDDIKLKFEFNCKEKLLQEYKDTVDESSIISKSNPNGIITYVNKQFCELSGFKQSELIGKNHNIVRHPDMQKEAFADMWKTIKENKQTWHGKVKNKKKDGGYYWVEATIKPIIDNNGDIVEFIGLRTDITELENYKILLKNQLDDTNKSLKENINYVKQYEEAVNNSLAVIKTDTSNIIIDVNEYFCKISGFSRNELIGINCQKFRHENHFLLKDCERIQKTLSQNKHLQITFTNIAKDGEYFITDSVVYPISNYNGEVTEHLHLMHNITELTNLHQEIEDTQKEIVYKMGEIGESRSKETGNHVKRVAEYSKLLALLYGLSKDDSNTLFTASPMHDIGKVAIPDSILNKPGKLTKEEFEVMKSHSSIGYDVLKGSKRKVLKAAAIVAHEHHEKWDGSGYPRGLKGKDIHIYGRITAIVDVYDALGHERVYKKAWELEKIYKLFQDNKEIHFDPSLVDIFLKNKYKFEKIRDSYDD